MAKPALGRGLGALLGGNPIAKPQAPAVPASSAAIATHAVPSGLKEGVRTVPIGQIQPCPFQPRKHFAPEALEELAASIRTQGIVQPLVVRSRNQHLELIAGERRWRAAQMAGLAEVPVVLREADDREVLELALIENLQRENLNPLEEAQGYAQLAAQFDLTQEQIAAKVGKSRAVVANALRILKLPPAVLGHIREGRISTGHAKVILGLGTEAEQIRAAEKVVADGLNVRQAEVLVNAWQTSSPSKPAGQSKTRPDPHVSQLENKMRERLGTKVSLRYAQGKGAVEISFYSDAELQRVLEILGINPD